jgi:hypothetical protein
MKGGLMQFKHLRSKIIEAKRGIQGIMSTEHPSQVPDREALDKGEKMMPRTSPPPKMPDYIKKDVPDFIQQDRDAAEKAKIDNERARQNYSASVSATDAAFKEIDRQDKQKHNQDIEGHSTNKGRGWEGKVGTKIR